MYNRRTHKYVQFKALIYSWRNRVQKERHGEAEWVCLNGYSHTSYSPVCKKGGTQGARFKFWLCLELPMTLNKAFDFPGSVSFSRKQEGMLSKIPAPLLQFSHPNFLPTLNQGQSCQRAWGGEEDLGALLGTTIVLNIFVLLQPPTGGQTSKKINKALPFVLDLFNVKKEKKSKIKKKKKEVCLSN